MSIPRRKILPNGSLSHLVFRCHNRQRLLQDDAVKIFLLLLWAKYRIEYGIKILEFSILDNHVHLQVRAHSTEALGHFMRNVNSQLARFVNKLLDRDSQVIRERYKSPLITSDAYAFQTMQYIWLNRLKAMHRNPRFDPFCSLSWRLNPEVIKTFQVGEEGENLLRHLLSTEDRLYSKNVRKFCLDLFNAAMSKAELFEVAVFDHSHTIGDFVAVEARASILNAFRIEKNPWPASVSALLNLDRPE